MTLDHLPVLLAVAFVLFLGAVLLVRNRFPRPPMETAAFQAKTLLNTAETRLFHQIDQRLPQPLRLMAQVSFGEMVRTRDRRKFLTINARRAKMVVVDKGFKVMAVIQYHGRRGRKPGGRSDIARRRVLEEAGIPLIEIDEQWTGETLDHALNTIIPSGEAAQ